jgi:hypothetical protein
MSLDVLTCTRSDLRGRSEVGTDDGWRSYRHGVRIARVRRNSRPGAGNGVVVWGILAGASSYVVVVLLVVVMGAVLVITHMVKNSAHPMRVRLRFLGFEVSRGSGEVEDVPTDPATGLPTALAGQLPPDQQCERVTRAV